jgi:type I restriction enzyme S subunit
MDLRLSLSNNLEKLADAYFRAWFIDYNVTSSLIIGEQHSSIKNSDVSRELFGESFKETEIGNIPNSWEVGTLGDYCDVLLGGTPSRSNPSYWNGDIPWINSGKVNDFRITTASEWITQKGLQGSSTKVMPKGTTVLAITGATLGQYSRLEFECCANQSVIGLVPKTKLTNNFVYLSLKHDINQLVDKQTGGAQQHINRNDVVTFKFALPPEEVIQAFEEIVAPIFDAISELS